MIFCSFWVLVCLLTVPSLSFDPRISPHLYGGDAPPSVGARKWMVVMDHGSGRMESNERLKIVAEKVNERIKQGQLSSYLGCSHCHMELSPPTLSSVVKDVHDSKGVKEFLVHPLFISPLGKHVKVDIPEIVRTTNEEMKGEGVSVEMGKVFGDDLDKLVDGILSVVKEEEDGEGGEGPGGLGGFGAIMEMLKAQETSGS